MTDIEIAIDIVRANKERISNFLSYKKIMFDDELEPHPVRCVARLISDAIEKEFDLEEYVLNQNFQYIVRVEVLREYFGHQI